MIYVTTAFRIIIVFFLQLILLSDSTLFCQMISPEALNTGGRPFCGRITKIDSLSLQAMFIDTLGNAGEGSLIVEKYTVIQDVDETIIPLSSLKVDEYIHGYYVVDKMHQAYALSIQRGMGSTPGGRPFFGIIIKVDSNSVSTIQLYAFSSSGSMGQSSIFLDKYSKIQDENGDFITISKLAVDDYVHGYYYHDHNGDAWILKIQRGMGSTPGGRPFFGRITQVSSMIIQLYAINSVNQLAQGYFWVDKYSVFKDEDGHSLSVSQLSIDDYVHGYYYHDKNNESWVLLMQRGMGSTPGGRSFSGRIIKVDSNSVSTIQLYAFDSSGVMGQSSILLDKYSKIQDENGAYITISKLLVDQYIHGYYYIDKNATAWAVLIQRGLGSTPGGRSFSGRIIKVDSSSVSTIQLYAFSSSGTMGQSDLFLDKYSRIQDENGAFITVSKLAVDDYVHGYYYRAHDATFWVIKIQRGMASNPGGSPFSGRILKVDSSSISTIQLDFVSSYDQLVQGDLLLDKYSRIQDENGAFITISKLAIGDYVNGYSYHDKMATSWVIKIQIIMSFTSASVDTTGGGSPESTPGEKVQWSGIVHTLWTDSLKIMGVDSTTSDTTYMIITFQSSTPIKDETGDSTTIEKGDRIGGEGIVQTRTTIKASYIIKYKSQQSPGTVTMACDSVTGAAGSAVTVSIFLFNPGSNIAGGQFIITPSSSDYLSFKVAGTSTRTSGWTVASNSSGNGQMVMFYSTSGAVLSPGSGKILVLSYEISSKAPKDTSIALILSNAQVSDDNQKAVSVSLFNGQIRVGTCNLFGDINNDGVVNIFDVLLIVQYIMAKQTPTSQQQICADMDHDGAITVFDIVACVNKGLGKTTLLAGSGTTGKQDIDLAGLTADLRILGADETLIKDITEIYSRPGDKPELPKAFYLGQNEPNPFNPATTISYSVPEGAVVRVVLKIFDLRGRLVRTLVNEAREPANYKVFWDGTNESGRKVASGVYFYRLSAGDFRQTRKMILLK